MSRSSRLYVAAMLALILVVWPMGVRPVAAQSSSVLRAGDLNVDGAVNVVDVQLAVNIALGDRTDPIRVLRADLNGDGKVNVVDVQRVVNLALGVPSALEISSFPDTPAIPLTPLRFGTSGLVSGLPVSVKFLNSSGTIAELEPIRVDQDGTVVVGVPLVVDPTTSVTTSATVYVVVSQVLSSDIALSGYQPLTIQNLPSLQELGVSLGRITQAYFTFSLLLTQNRLTHLRILEAMTKGAVDTSAARTTLVMIRDLTLATRMAVERIMASPTDIISVGIFADGTPIPFTRESLELMDRLLAGWIVQLPFARSALVPATQIGALSNPAFAISAAASSDLEAAITTIESIGGMAQAAKEIQASETIGELGLAFGTGAVAAAATMKIVPPQVALIATIPTVLKDTQLLASDATRLLEDVLLDNNAGATADLQALKKSVPDFTLTAIKLGAALAVLANPALAVPATVVSLGANLITWQRDGTLKKLWDLNGRIADTLLASSNLPLGGIQVQVDVAVSNGTLSGVVLDCVVCCPLPPPLRLQGITDPFGRALLPVPLGLTGSPPPSTLTVTVSDLVTGGQIDTTSFNAQGTINGQTIKVNLVVPSFELLELCNNACSAQRAARVANCDPLSNTAFQCLNAADAELRSCFNSCARF